MSETRVGVSGGRRSRSEADRLVAEFEQSGLRRTAFCLAHGISAHTLDYYRRQRRGKPPVAELVPVELVGVAAVEVTSGARLRVELSNGRGIVVEEGFSASLLQSVVAALEP